MLSFPNVVRLVAVLSCLTVAMPSIAQQAEKMGVSEASPNVLPVKGSVPYLKAIELLKTGADYDVRIINGKLAKPGQFPWQVALLVVGNQYNKNGLICGGTLIASQWVVTAAHCVDRGMKPEQIQALAGEISLRTTTANRTDVQRIVVHPDWNAKTWDNDIALLHLSSPVIGNNILPIPPMSPSEESKLSAETKFLVSGWGRIKEKGPFSPDLLWADVGFIDQSTCNGPAQYRGQITDNMLCAGTLLERKDACGGDSGGPLVLESLPVALVGVVSWGIGCGRTGTPGVYTRVVKFASWIANEIK